MDLDLKQEHFTHKQCIRFEKRLYSEHQETLLNTWIYELCWFNEDQVRNQIKSFFKNLKCPCSEHKVSKDLIWESMVHLDGALEQLIVFNSTV